MNILNFITGLFIIFGDVIKELFLFLYGSISIFFQKNKSNNAFLKFFISNCWISFYIFLFLVFIVIGHFSVLLGIFAAFVSAFMFDSYKEEKFKKYNTENYESGYNVFATTIFLLSIIGYLFYNYDNTAYEYKEVGKYTFTKSELLQDKAIKDEKGIKTVKTIKIPRNYLEMVFNGNEIKVDVKDCKEGEHIIYEEILPIKYLPVKYFSTDFYADCSSRKINYKEIKE